MIQSVPAEPFFQVTRNNRFSSSSSSSSISSSTSVESKSWRPLHPEIPILPHYLPSDNREGKQYEEATKNLSLPNLVSQGRRPRSLEPASFLNPSRFSMLEGKRRANRGDVHSLFLSFLNRWERIKWNRVEQAFFVENFHFRGGVMLLWRMEVV